MVADKIQAVNAQIEVIQADTADITLLLAQKANVTDLNATNANVQSLQAAQAALGEVVAGKADIGDLQAAQATIGELSATTANITQLLSGSAGVGDLQAIHISGDNVVFDDATVAEAVMADLMAGRVTAATIYTDFIKIGSQDGALSIDGATIQIKDAAGTVRVQIGKDGSGNFSYYLWDAAGNLIWSPDGIQAAGVPDGLIVNDMVSDRAAIDGSKLNIHSVAEALNEDGSITVEAAKVTIDDKTLAAAYTEITRKQSDTDEAMSALGSDLTVVKDQISQKVWQTDIDTAADELGGQITTLSDQYTQQQTTIGGIQQTIGSLQTSLEEKADGSTVQEISQRLNTVEETSESFTRTISEVQTKLAKTVAGVTTYYILSDSKTQAPPVADPGWSIEAPSWEEGKFMWQKNVTSYTDGTSEPSEPVCLAGATGASGEDAILLRIDSSRGTVFKNNAVSTVLSVIIYHGGTRIETSTQLAAEFGSGAYLQWEWLRMDDDTYGTIVATDERLSDNGFHFTLSPEDVDAKVTFRCNLMI